MKLQPGDHVAQKDLTDEQYHAIAKKFMEAGALSAAYSPDCRSSGNAFFGWDARDNTIYFFRSLDVFTGRLLTPSQILEDDNGWFERGELPPVGIECEINEPRKDFHGRKIHIFSHYNGCAFGWDDIEQGAYHSDKPYEFRPIKSDRDKAIEKAADVIGKALMSRDQLGTLFDHGLLKLPEGESNER